MTETLGSGPQPPRVALLRLQLKPKVPGAPYVDGAWWPWSLQLPVELPALLPTLSDRLGSIAMVVFDIGQWDNAPASLTVDGAVVRLEGVGDTSGHQSHGGNTLTVVGTGGDNVTLVVVPPDASGPAALRSLTAASQTGPADATADAEARALHEVIGLLSRQEPSQNPTRTAQIRGWVHETADQFDDAPVKTFVPILVEHIVRNRMLRTPA